MSKVVTILFFLCCSLLGGLVSFAQSPAVLLDSAKAHMDRRELDRALATATDAGNKAIASRDTPLLIRALTLQGKATFALKKDKEAVDLYFQALRLCHAPEHNADIAYLNGEIGYVYYSKGKSAEAIHYYQRELAIRRKLNGPDSVGNQLINIAVMHQDLKQYDSSALIFNEVADIIGRNKDVKMEGYYLLNRGALMQFTGQLDSAAWYYSRAYEVLTKAGVDGQAYKAIFNLGYLAWSQKKFPQAIEYYHQAEQAALKYGFAREIAHVYGTMAEAYASIKDYPNAYNYLYKYATMSDSLSQDKFSRYVVEMDKKYQSEQSREVIQQQSLALQKAEVDLQKQRNHKLVIAIALVLVLLVTVIVVGYLRFQASLRKEVDAAKNKFFANVAHEIRTPLSMVMAPVNLLKTKVSDPDLIHQLDIASRNAQRLNELIDQMLDLSKIDAAKYTLQEQVGSLQDFCGNLAAQYEELAKNKNIHCSFDFEGIVTRHYFDADALHKVLGNLLGNAIKYTPAGGAVGLVARVAGQGSSASATFTVWDTGPGIGSAEKERIFNRFYRAPAQQQAGSRGLGIGLSLVQDLVNLMHGTISLDSEPAKGAVFTVSLPLRAYDTASEQAGLPTNGFSVLLVEDDAEILHFNQSLLAAEGYQVLTARNGQEGLDLILAQLPDLVVTDVMMPEKDGLALLRDIRQHPLTNHIPVIILSARASVAAKLEGLSNGAQGYLPKPFLPQELVAMVQAQLHIVARQRAAIVAEVAGQAKAENTPSAATDHPTTPDPFATRCLELINQHLDDAQLSVEKLAEMMNTNRSHFQRKVKALTGLSPSELIRTVRLEKAITMLRRKEGNITEVAYATGFTSQSYFTKCFSDHFGYPPSQVKG